MWQSYLKVEEKEHPLFCNKGIFNLKERASLLCEVWLLHSLYSISPTRRLITKESVKETNAMRVISQPQMLDKLEEAESLLDDIQEGLEWLFGEEKTILSKVNSPLHLSVGGGGIKTVCVNTYKFLFFNLFFLNHFQVFFVCDFFFFQCSNDLSRILSETKDPLHIQPHLKKCFEGIAKLTFNHEKEITHMESAENEKVELVLWIIPASAKGLVEQWLHEVNIFSSYLGFSYCIIIFSFRSNEYHKHISYLNSSLNICQDVDRFQPYCCYLLQLI